MKVLVVGSGGREQALTWKISQSPLVKTLISAPGNPGMARYGASMDLSADQVPELVEFAVREAITLVVIGPEISLAKGLADQLREKGIACFGPNQKAAQLESSKAFTKAFCSQHGIPTANSITVKTLVQARAALKQFSKPYVLKADGLAGGKGVVICTSIKEAEKQAEAFLKGLFGNAGKTLIIEEFLEGEEVSVFALCDGKTALPFQAVQDHKRAFDGDRGPNTGGMGSYSPTPMMREEQIEQVMETIVHPTLQGMAEADMPYQGVLYAGVMITAEGPKLIEYNVRFGDPECQVLMMRLDSDIVPLLKACAEGTLSERKTPLWSKDAVVTVVLASEGYPGDYKKNVVLPYLDKIERMEGITVFHAGTGYNHDHKLVAIGGRVLNITAKGKTLPIAVDRAYQALEAINWEKGFYRKDIAWRALKTLHARAGNKPDMGEEKKKV